MGDKIPTLFPFLTREMLSFGKGASFELETVVYSNSNKKVEMVGITKDGIIKFDIRHSGDSTEDVSSFKIPDIPIMLNIFTDEVTVDIGDFFVSVYLKVNGERVMKLMSGYVSKQSGVSYPQAHDENEMPLHGNLNMYSLVLVTAGTEFSQTVPDNRRWLVKYVAITFVSDANAATRQLHVLFSQGTTGTDRSIVCVANGTQIESLTKKYSFASYGGSPPAATDDFIMGLIPMDIEMNAGSVIRSVTDNIQVGDQFNKVYMFVEEFFED